jgi:hypothetical protein
MSQNDENRDLALVRARYGFNVVRDWREQWRKDAAQRVKGLPVAIRTQGLMIAVAMLMREDKAAARQLADRLANWLLEEAPHGPLRSSARGEASGRRLLEVCMKASRGDYLAAEREAILFFDQVKIYADALNAAEGWSR